jgi:hypothetical protein
MTTTNTTTTCDEIAAELPGLAALPPDDPARGAAEAHALGCPTCGPALQDAQRLMRALDDAAPLPDPSPRALLHAAAPILSDLAPAAEPRGGVRQALVPAAAAIAAWALPLALARRPLGGGRTLGISLVLGLVAALAAAATVATGGVLAGAFPLLSALFSLNAGEGPAFEAGIGVHCALTELAVAAGAALLTVLATRRRAQLGDGQTLMVAAAGGGALAGQAALHLTCPASAELPHLLLFHTGALLLAVVLAVATGDALLRFRPASRR